MSQQSSAGSSPFDESEAADMLTSMVAGGPILDGAYFSGVRPNAGPDAEEATPTDSTKPVSPRTPSPRVRTACSAPTPSHFTGSSATFPVSVGGLGAQGGRDAVIKAQASGCGFQKTGWLG